MIQAIYFDLGGVMLRTTNKTPRTELAAEFGLTYLQLDKLVFDWATQPTAQRASIGAITEEAHWICVARALGRAADEYPRIRDTFFDGDTLDWELVNFLREMRKTHKTGLISNAWSGLRPWIVQAKFTDAFDHLTISAEVGMTKPNPQIYHHALQALQMRPEQAIFVDDFIENVHAAAALGMHAIRYQSTEQTLAEIRNLL